MQTAVQATDRAGSPSEVMVAVRDLHKNYDTGDITVTALNGVSLDVRRGEMLAIMGPSGCGKTTLLNCISGLDVYDSGSVMLDGVDLATMSDRQKTSYRAHK